MKVVQVKGERCINCHLCEVACTIEHSSTKGAVSAYFVEGLTFNWDRAASFVDPADAAAADRPAPLTRCRVWSKGHEALATLCRHCKLAPCILACKNGSLYRDEAGRVLVDEQKCVGCWMCIMACPHGAITRNVNKVNVAGAENGGINHHCDLCPNRPIPACVYVCPTQALVYEEQEEAGR